ncbi:alpha/beta fold hydrolase [Streptomyces sp. NPDC051322]|uniref:alpha/beta fold hydrolase n=1 Tax=Streptomyces sp. NPDC051322 TaxID=3154645 RepID=UPI00344C0A76
MPALDGAVHRWVTAGDVRLHIAEFGAGRPVVLLHGFPQHWYAWDRLVPLLAADHRLICVDLRGFGWSEQTRRGYDTDSAAGAWQTRRPAARPARAARPRPREVRACPSRPPYPRALSAAGAGRLRRVCARAAPR